MLLNLAIVLLPLLILIVVLAVVNRRALSGNPETDKVMGLYRYGLSPNGDSASGVREELTAKRWEFDPQPEPAPAPVTASEPEK